MAYVLDLIVVAAFVLFIYLGYRRGFVKSIVQLIGSILALVIAFAVSTPLSGMIYDSFLSSGVRQTIDNNMPDTQTDGIKNAAEELLDSIPDFVVNALKNQNLGTPEQILGELDDRVGSTRESLIDSVEQRVVRPLAVSLLRPFCCLIVFILLLVAVFIVARIVNKVFEIPGLKQINHSLGAITGVLQGIIFILIAVMILSIISVTVKSDSIWSRKNVERSIIVSRIEKVNPFSKAVRDLLDDTRILPNQ